MNQEASMQKTKLSLPMEITFDLTRDRPETSGLMAFVRKKGFQQEKIGGNGTRVRLTGNFTGTLDDLKALCCAVKSHRKKD